MNLTLPCFPKWPLKLVFTVSCTNTFSCAWPVCVVLFCFFFFTLQKKFMEGAGRTSKLDSSGYVFKVHCCLKGVVMNWLPYLTEFL